MSNSNDYIATIKELASKLRKLPYGACGQSVGIQSINTQKGMLGIKILNAIKEYETWYSETFGGI